MQFDEQPAPHVFHQRHARLDGKGFQFHQRRGRGEADDAVIAGMNAQQQAGLRRNRLLVIAQVRAVRRPDFAQNAAALPNHVWNPKTPADFDEFAARHNRLFSRANRRQRQQRGRRVIIDDECGFAAEQFA